MSCVWREEPGNVARLRNRLVHVYTCMYQVTVQDNITIYNKSHSDACIILQKRAWHDNIYCHFSWDFSPHELCCQTSQVNAKIIIMYTQCQLSKREQIQIYCKMQISKLHVEG